ncbi:MAG: YybH family protein [Gemmatimonadales bacterium]
MIEGSEAMNGPIDTVNALVNAINRADIEGALALYEPDAVLVPRPGQVARGAADLRAALARFLALKPVLVSEAQQVVQSGDTALYLGRWELRGTDENGDAVVLRGDSTDVLRCQPAGHWLVAIDNPWGAELLGPR